MHSYEGFLRVSDLDATAEEMAQAFTVDTRARFLAEWQRLDEAFTHFSPFMYRLRQALVQYAIKGSFILNLPPAWRLHDALYIVLQDASGSASGTIVTFTIKYDFIELRFRFPQSGKAHAELRWAPTWFEGYTNDAVRFLVDLESWSSSNQLIPTPVITPFHSYDFRE